MDNLNLDNYKYELPESRIARFPLKERSQSKLLYYNKGQITHHTFSHIGALLPPESLLVFNETKVIPARLSFHKKTGASIEIMLLNPIAPSSDINISMSATIKVTWKCMIKNLRKWNPENILELSLPMDGDNIHLKATLVSKAENFVEFAWGNNHYTFSEVLEISGKVPIPPYLKREPVPQDKPRYQTVYSKNDGAVAAPTAGLHFTKKIIQEIVSENHITDYITLHVSAGTFRPIKAGDIKKHDMHRECIIVKKSNIINLINNIGNTIAVGTTSMRTLESMYWFGVKLLRTKENKLFIEKLFPYQHNPDDLPSIKDAFQAVINHMDTREIEVLHGETEIFIFPGYSFKVCSGLITNYHMPTSTLLLLVAAFVGEDWKKIYKVALEEDYRFLSYGDSSFLLPAN
jgi:S-adenosylmethionine:tRNA ribosyltransferase-isomerase